MTRQLKILALLLGTALAGASIAATIIVSVLRPNPGIFITQEGAAVVGYEFRIVLKVVWPSAMSSGLVFVSCDCFDLEMIPNAVEDDPWELANVWNLTGLDLSEGQVFTLRAIPVWGAEYVLHALAWSVLGNLSGVRFPPASESSFGGVDSGTVRPLVSGAARLTVAWPLELRVGAEGTFVVGGEVQITTTVSGTISGAAHVPTLLYLSVETKPVYYRILSADAGDDPWGMPNVWNLTGFDLSRGLGYTLTVSPELRGVGIPLEARVWSPRGAWPDVTFNATGEMQNLGSVRLWASLTVEFTIG